MALNEKKVKRLIGLMNEMSGFKIPAMKPIIRCFEAAMDEDILEFLLRVGTASHSEETLADLFQTMQSTNEISGNRTWEEFWDEVKSMAFLFPCESGSKYELAPIFPGWLELSCGGERNQKNTQIMETFMEFWDFLETINVGPIRAYMNAKGIKNRDADITKVTTLTSVVPAGKKRTISVNEPLQSEQQVLTAGTVFEILERHKDQISVMNCICRNHKELQTGETCSHGVPLQSCMPVGDIADQLVEYGIARKLTHEEAVELVSDFERKGCIHTTFHYGNDASREVMGICNCCSECCLLFGSLRDNHLSMIQAKALNKPVVINPDACTGCGICQKACLTGALTVDRATRTLSLDYESCVGCGQCVTQCRFGVQEMVPDERAVFVRTPKKGAFHA